MQTGGASDGGVAVLHRGVRVLFCVPAQARSAQNHISIILPSREFCPAVAFLQEAIMAKVKVTVTESRCRTVYCGAGDMSTVEDICPPTARRWSDKNQRRGLHEY